MGSNQFGDRMERKQYQNSDWIVHTFDWKYIGDNIQRVSKMAETKFAVLIINLLGIPVCFFAFIKNIDNVKSAFIFLAAMSFLLIRMYFFVIWAKQKTRKNELELRAMENDLKKDTQSPI
jgi:ABC-type transport system involved in cytochrome bd biosynthesis fused ATPase/permease subunit